MEEVEEEEEKEEGGGGEGGGGGGEGEEEEEEEEESLHLYICPVVVLCTRTISTSRLGVMPELSWPILRQVRGPRL